MKPVAGETIVQRLRITSAVLAALCIVSFAALAQSGETDTARHPDCFHCGMDRDRFGHSRMLITYADGSETGTCSIRCAAVELAGNSRKYPRTIEVGDYQTRALIDAENAFWVIGGSKRGVMSARAKWAFARREEAERFIAVHGGVLATFDEALQGAYTDLYEDFKSLRERRKEREGMHGDGHQYKGHL